MRPFIGILIAIAIAIAAFLLIGLFAWYFYWLHIFPGRPREVNTGDEVNAWLETQGAQAGATRPAGEVPVSTTVA
ncbi:hypothetical protein UCDDS831_g07193 [Diplodia seriata]|uniref:Uncharacterized protein n=1 Tax=Diplodia seriata TaxID=420778 RepID=A0A0G2GGU7_9PEZI|nr:hypothetical protein UCDDS831_g07193 [Diplodia seriata]